MSGVFSTLFAFLACIAGNPLPPAVAADAREPPAARPGPLPATPVDAGLASEWPDSLFHSLPIAGLVVTPDAIAERVLQNPRLRATASQPSSGKGAAYPIPESSAVSTRADPP